jgi:hypothetical protein
MDVAGMAARAIKRACSRPQHGERGTIATTMAKRLADVVGKIRCTLERNAPYDLQTAALLSRNRTQQDKGARSKAGSEACLGWVGYDRQERCFMHQGSGISLRLWTFNLGRMHHRQLWREGCVHGGNSSTLTEVLQSPPSPAFVPLSAPA